MKPAHISARRWFDGQNTYHSVCIYFSDGTERIEPFKYGYGDHFFHTAGVLCEMSDPYTMGMTYFRNECKITYEVVDVRRKKDLHNAGRAL